MLNSLRTRLKSLRQDRDSSSDARLLRQARKAERRVIQTATAELQSWEQERGYVKTACRTAGSSPALSLKETDLPVGESERTLYEGKSGEEGEEGLGKDGNGMFSQGVDSGQQKRVDPVPQITLSLLTHDGMGILTDPEHAASVVSLDTGSALTQAEAGAASAAPSLEVKAIQLQDTNALKVLEEKEALLREIQQIRKTISDLRTGVASSSMSSEKPADLAPPMPESTPWLGTTRTVSVHRPRRKNVADLFAEDAPLPTQPYCAGGIASSTAPQLSLWPELEGAASSMPSSLARRRSRSLGASTLLAESKAASVVSSETPRPSAHRKSSTVATRPKTLYDQPSSLQVGTSNEHRRIIVSEEEKSQRYRASLGRTDTKTTSAGRGTAAGARSSEMTLSELQERHLAKLLQLQRPTTTKLAEAQALTTAREQWRQRQEAERQAQEVKLRERQTRDTQLATEAKGTKSRGQSFRYSVRSRSKSALDPAAQPAVGKKGEGSEAGYTLERPSTSFSAQLEAYNRPPKRAEGIRRAGQWRQSVPAPSNAHGHGEGDLARRAVGQPLPSRAQSSVGLVGPHEAHLQQAARSRPHRSYSSAGLLTVTQDRVPVPTPVELEGDPLGTPGGQARRSRRELTATDIRRMREGAGRRKSTMLA